MNITILIPVYNDWVALSHLVTQLSAVLAEEFDAGADRARILVVDDGSSQSPALDIDLPEAGMIERVDVLTSAVNTGHQRAIVLGLAHLARQTSEADSFVGDYVVVMDADGEDRPEDVPRLVREAINEPGKIVLAIRKQRSESIGFRLGYACYRLLFRVLAGIRIGHGNFCVLPAGELTRLASDPRLWNHFAASLLISKRPLVHVDTRRGYRLSGGSKMASMELFSLGFSAISVFLEQISIRAVLGSGVLAVLAAAGLLGLLVAERSGAIDPAAWVWILGLIVLAVAVQVGLWAFAAILFTSYNRQRRHFVPLHDSYLFERDVRTLLSKKMSPPA